MSILAPVLDPLVDAYVPNARTDETLKNDLLAHCQDILKRYTHSYSCVIAIKLRSPSHIGQRTETDFSHLTDLVKRRRTF